MPAIGIGTLAAKATMEFGDAVAKVSTIADTSKVPISALRDGILELSNQTGISANELAEAEYQALSASVDTAKVTTFLGTATKAAKGGFTDTATAVDGLTNVLNAYGYEADKADKIANQMLITQNLGKTTFGELAKSMGKVNPIASALQMKTEELFSSMAVTTAQGLDTAESVTGLKAALSNIVKPSKEAAEAADLLGIKFKASEIKTKGWMPFLKDLSNKLRQTSPALDQMSKNYSKNASEMARLEKQGKKNTEMYRNLKKANKNIIKDMEMLAKAGDSDISAMATMFGSVEGLNTVLMLTSDTGMKKYNESMGQMKTNTTAVQDAVDKLQTPGAKFKKALNSLNLILIKLGDALVPTIEKATKYISKLTDKLSKLTPKQTETIVKFTLMAATIGPVLLIVSKLALGISNTIKGIDNFIKRVGRAGGALKYFTSPGHLVVLSLLAIVGVTLLVIKHWDTLSKGFKKHSKTIKTVAAIITAIFLPALIKIGVQAAITGGKLAVGLIAKVITLGIQGAKTAAIFTGKLIVSIINFALEGWKSVGAIVAQTGAWIIQKGVVIAHTIGLIALKVAQIGLTGATKLLTGALKLLNLAFVSTPIGWIVLGIAGVIAAVIGLHKAWTSNWHGIQEKTEKVINKIKEAWNGLKTFLSHPIKGTISLIKNGNLSGVKGKNALGTSYWGGGLSVVGEHGPEVVELPQGAAVHDNKDSKRMFNKGGNIAITFGDVHVRKESDIDAIANAIVKKLQVQQLNMA